MFSDVVRDAFAFHREMVAANGVCAIGETSVWNETALTAFCGEECHTVGAESHALLRDLSARFHEPRSVPWDDVEALLSAARATRLGDASDANGFRDENLSGVSKLLLAAYSADVIDAWRPRWEQLVAGRATITRAVSTMLEVLPVGHDKTTGFTTLLRSFESTGGGGSDDERFPALRVVAVGDGENDAGMLRAATVGVAMGNACVETKRAADHVLDATNDEDGVAEAIRKFVL
jgi:hypothetical protein